MRLNIKGDIGVKHNYTTKLLSASSRAIIVAALCGPIAANAQSAPQSQSPSDAPETTEVGDIVVTAQRRDQSILKVPISISAIGGQELAARNITSTAALSQSTPNLYQTNASLNGGPIAIRGVSTFDINAGIDQAVAVYIDDVYQGTAVGSAANLFDVERVEVLRGPQSTFFGRNSLAGAVSITTRRPDYTLRGEAQASYGNYNAFTVKGLVNVPLKQDVAALSVGVIHSEHDGYAYNLLLKEGVNYDRRTNARAQLRLQPTSNVDILATYEYLKANGARSFDPFLLNLSPRGLTGVNATLLAGTFTVPFNADGYDRRLSSDVPAAQELESHTASLRANIDFGWSNLLLISSYRTHRLDDSFDADLTEAPLSPSANPERYEAFTQEVRLSSNTKGPLTWIAGLTYHQQQTRVLTNASSTPLDAILVGLPDLASATGPTAVDGRIKTNSYSAFGRLDWQFAERFALGIGGRFTHELKRLRTSQSSPLFNQLVFGFPEVPETRDRFAYNDFSPEIKLSFTASPTKLLYASVSKGFKGGGYNDQQISQDQFDSGDYRRPFKREQLWNYELGFKGSFFDRRLSVSAAVFYADWLDRQFQAISGNGVNSLVVLSSGDARVVGVELDLRARPVDGLEVYANGGYNEIKQTKSLIAEVRKGEVLDATPQYNVSLGAIYTADLKDQSQIQATVGYNLIGPNDITIGGSVVPGDNPALAIKNDVYGLLNSKIAYTFPSKQITISVFGDNLLDTKYLAGSFSATYSLPTFGVAGVILGPPRTYGVSASFRF